VHSGIDSRKIVLVGFSQGAALSLMVGLTTLHELGGVASLSGWIPCRIREVSHNSKFWYHNADMASKQIIHTGLYLPILWCHGTNDMEIPVSMGEDAISFLHNILDIPEECLTYKRYEGLGHMINDAELDDLTSWLIQTLA
jgi:predicted esterase